MRSSVWFVVPAHGRVDLAAVCLRQLARTCAALVDAGVDASAVVIACDANLETAVELDFGTIERPNDPLGRKWNDGYELAGRTGVDYVIPFGSDDWIDHELVLAWLVAPGDVRCTRSSAVVNETGNRLARLNITYGGNLDFGDGVRMIPTELLAAVRYRPAEEDAKRAIDTSVWHGIAKSLGRKPVASFTELHSLQIVDFKSRAGQLNPYAGFLTDRRIETVESDDPFGQLAAIYPAAAVEEMAALYDRKLVAA